MESTIKALREWIIQRCTQRWEGNDLIYEDFPTPEGLMTRDEMVVVLDRVNREYPDEFRGHRVPSAGRACADCAEELKVSVRGCFRHQDIGVGKVA